MEDIKLEDGLANCDLEVKVIKAKVVEDGLARCEDEVETIKSEPMCLDDPDFTVMKSEPVLLTGDTSEPSIGDTSNPNSSYDNETVKLLESRTISPEKQILRVETPLNNKDRQYVFFEEGINGGTLKQHGEPCSKKSPLLSDKSNGISTNKPKEKTTEAYEVYVCHCDYNAPTRAALSRHQESHTKLPYPEKQTHSCDYCGFVFGRRHSLAAHVRSVHSVYIEAKRYACDFCVFSTDNRPMFLRHMNIHSGVSFPCGSCDCGFDSRILLDHHIRLVHSGICNICGYATPEGESLKNHLRRDHLGEKLHDCDHCDFIGGAIEVLRAHMLANHFRILQKYNPPSPTTSPPPLQSNPVLACSECGYKTNEDKDLKAHTKLYHGRRCLICGYTVEFFMMAHVKTHSYELQNLVRQNLAQAEEFSCQPDPKRTGLKRNSGSEEPPVSPKIKNNIVHTRDAYDNNTNNKKFLETQTKIHTDDKQQNCSWMICSPPVIGLEENETPVGKEYDPLTCSKIEQSEPVKSHTEERIEDRLSLPSANTKILKKFKCKPQHEYPSKKRPLKIQPFEHTQMYKCGGCDFNTSDKSRMKAHLEIHIERQRHFREYTAYTCCMCGYRFRNASSLIAHKLESHEKTELPSSKKVIQIKRSEVTLKHDTNIMYKCGGCDFNTLNKSTMLTHTEVHKESEPFIGRCQTYAYGQSASPVIGRKFDNHSVLRVLDNPSKPRTLKPRASEPEISKVMATHSVDFRTAPSPALKVISDHEEHLLKVRKTESHSPKVQVLSADDIPVRPGVVLDKPEDPSKKQGPRKISMFIPKIEQPETDYNFMSVVNYFESPEIQVNHGLYDAEDDGTYACNDCNYMTELQTDFAEHLRSHVEQEMQMEDPLALPS